MTDFECNPVGTAEALRRLEDDPLARQIIRMRVAMLSQTETIRELSEKFHKASLLDKQKVAFSARALTEQFGVNAADARRYAKTIFEAASARASRASGIGGNDG